MSQEAPCHQITLFRVETWRRTQLQLKRSGEPTLGKIGPDAGSTMKGETEEHVATL